MSRARTILAPLALVAAAFAVQGCNSTGGGGGGTAGGTAGGGTVAAAGDAAGDVLVERVLRIASIDDSTLNTDGTVRYYLENISGELQEDLIYSVQFLHPAAKDEDVAMDYRSEMTPDRGLVMFKTDTAKEVVAVSQDRRAGEEIMGTRIYAYVQTPVRTVERRDGEPGTKFLNGTLECVQLSGPWEQPPYVSVQVENISSSTLTGLEIQAVLLESDNKTRAGSTGWQPLDDMRPGQRAGKRFDLPKEYYGKNCWIQVRVASFL